MTTTRNKAPQPETTQTELLLVTGAPSAAHWKLDDQTKEIGRKGLAQAREALQAARAPHLDLAA